MITLPEQPPSIVCPHCGMSTQVVRQHAMLDDRLTVCTNPLCDSNNPPEEDEI